jgi:hypothetical protein
MALSGSLLERVQLTYAAGGDGMFLIDVHFNPQGVVGVAPDGTVYHGVGVTNDSTRIKRDTQDTPEFHDVLQYVNVFMFVGPNTSYTVTGLSHNTYTNGQLVATVGDFSFACR